MMEKKTAIIKVNVYLELQDVEENSDEELIPGIDCEINENSQIELNDILKQIVILGYPLYEALIFVYFPCEGEWKFATIFSEIYKTETIKLSAFMLARGEKFVIDLKAILSSPAKTKKEKRTIMDILRILKKWKKFGAGFPAINGSIFKMTMDHAAEFMGRKRKTLDEFVSLIKKARDLNFDFEKEKEEPLAKLRTFVTLKQL